MSKPAAKNNTIEIRKDQLGTVFASQTPSFMYLFVSSILASILFLAFSVFIKFPVGINANGIVKYESSVPLLAPYDGVITSLSDLDANRVKLKGDTLLSLARADTVGAGKPNEQLEKRYLSKQLEGLEDRIDKSRTRVLEYITLSNEMIDDVQSQIETTKEVVKTKNSILNIQSSLYINSTKLATDNMISKSSVSKNQVEVLREKEALLLSKRNLAQLEERKNVLLLEVSVNKQNSDDQVSNLMRELETINRELKLDSEIRRNELAMPFDGHVQGENLVQGGNFNNGDVILYATPLDAKLVFKADIFSRDIGDIQIGDTALIEILAFPSEKHGFLKAQISKIPTLPRSPKSEAIGVPELVKYSVLLEAYEEDFLQFTSTQTLRSGMRFRVRIVDQYTTLIELFLKPILRIVRRRAE